MTTKAPSKRKPKQHKVDAVASFEKEVQGKALIFVDYEGAPFIDLAQIRKDLRGGGGMLRVIKNTYMRVALESQKIQPAEEVYKGMSAVAIIGSDFSTGGKILFDAEKADKISIKGGYFEGKFVDAAFVKKMANIPPRDVLLAHLVGSLMGPISNLVFTLQAIAQKKEAGAAPETTPTT